MILHAAALASSGFPSNFLLSDGTRRLGIGDLIRCAERTQERPFGAVTPLERRDEY